MEEKGKPLLDKNIKSIVKFGGQVLWRLVFSSRSFGELVLIDDIIDKYKYLNILNDGLMGSVDMLSHKLYFPTRPRSKTHRKRKKVFFKERNIETSQ